MMRSKVLSALFPALVALAVAAHAPSAWGASVKQVRVGDHADFTRIVVELDGPAKYTVEQKSVAGGAELVLGLDATTATRVVSSRSRLVENVQLRPGPRGAEARISLRAGAVNVKEMVLQSPTRIVLDISPAKSAAATAATPTRTAVAPKPAPAPATSPTKVAATPTPTAAKSATPTPSPTTAKSATPTTAKSAMPTPSPTAAKSAPEAKPATSPTPTRTVLEPSVAAVAADQDAEEAADAAGQAPAGDDLEARALAKKRAEAMAAAKAAKAAAKPKEAASAEPAGAEPSLLDRLGGGDPGMGLTIALGGVAFLLAAFLLLRRRSQRIAQQAAEAPWPPPGAEERPEFAAAGAEEEERAPLVSMDDAPLFAATERDDDEGDEPVVELPEAPLDAEPEIAAKSDSPAVEELERRIERLEARLADSLDARERLERQLAAHTEELRVQRAAIARTQRAVRAAVRGPDAPEQPAAQRVPSQVPSPSADSQPGGGEG